MKFSSLLSLASIAFAAPSTLEDRDTASLTSVYNAVKALEGSVNTGCGSITKSLSSITGTASAALSLQVQASCNSNYGNIYKALQTCSSTITKYSLGSAGCVANSLKGLSASEVTTLVNTLTSATSTLNTLGTTISKTTSTLDKTALAAINTELTQVKNILGSFVSPLLILGNSCSGSKNNLNLNLANLLSAQSGLLKIITNLTKSLDLPDLTNILGTLLGSITSVVGGGSVSGIGCLKNGLASLTSGCGPLAVGLETLLQTLSGVLSGFSLLGGSCAGTGGLGGILGALGL